MSLAATYRLFALSLIVVCAGSTRAFAEVAFDFAPTCYDLFARFSVPHEGFEQGFLNARKISGTHGFQSKNYGIHFQGFYQAGSGRVYLQQKPLIPAQPTTFPPNVSFLALPEYSPALEAAGLFLRPGLFDHYELPEGVVAVTPSLVFDRIYTDRSSRSTKSLHYYVIAKIGEEYRRINIGIQLRLNDESDLWIRPEDDTTKEKPDQHRHRRLSLIHGAKTKTLWHGVITIPGNVGGYITNVDVNPEDALRAPLIVEMSDGTVLTYNVNEKPGKITAEDGSEIKQDFVYEPPEVEFKGPEWSRRFSIHVD